MIHTNIRKLLTPPRVRAFLGLLVLVGLSIASPLSAQTVTQGYGYDQPLQRGMIVQLKKDDATKVEPVSMDTVEQMYGIVVDANDAPVTLSPDGTKVFVATSGHFDVLVSTQNGPINNGDYITVSAISGIGMKSDTAAPVIIGRALAPFDGNSGLISSAEISDSAGNKRSVALGRIAMDVTVAKNPLLKATEPNLPGFLKKAAESIAGKQVSTARAYTAVTLFVISSIVAGVLLYGGVRSGIISIGRNPLSKKTVIRGMLQVILVGISIFLCGVFGVYLILKL